MKGHRSVGRPTEGQEDQEFTLGRDKRGFPPISQMRKLIARQSGLPRTTLHSLIFALFPQPHLSPAALLLAPLQVRGWGGGGHMETKSGSIPARTVSLLFPSLEILKASRLSPLSLHTVPSGTPSPGEAPASPFHHML